MILCHCTQYFLFLKWGFIWIHVFCKCIVKKCFLFRIFFVFFQRSLFSLSVMGADLTAIGVGTETSGVALSAPSQASGCPASAGGLNSTLSPPCSSWCSASPAIMDYLQADFGWLYHVKGLAMQGTPSGQRVTKFIVTSSTNGSTWTNITKPATATTLVNGLLMILFYFDMKRKVGHGKYPPVWINTWLQN